ADQEGGRVFHLPRGAVSLHPFECRLHQVLGIGIASRPTGYAADDIRPERTIKRDICHYYSPFGDYNVSFCRASKIIFQSPVWVRASVASTHGADRREKHGADEWHLFAPA